MSYSIKKLYSEGVIPKGAPAKEINRFLSRLSEMGLSPYTGEVFLLEKFISKDKPSYFTVTGIRGYRKLAIATGEYAGCSSPKYHFKKENDIPDSCEMGCLRIIGGRERLFSHVVFWDEYTGNQYNREIWEQKPRVMLAKVCEAGALRKAFPEIGDIYLREELDTLFSSVEMEQMKKETISREANDSVQKTINYLNTMKRNEK